MTLFRAFLAAAWICLVAYTGMVIAAHGLDFMPVYLGDIAAMAWPGQFDADFLCFLSLSALWTAWRNDFSPFGLLLGAVAFVGGAGFLLPYLLLLSIRARGNMAALLLGRSRASGNAGVR